MAVRIGMKSGQVYHSLEEAIAGKECCVLITQNEKLTSEQLQEIMNKNHVRCTTCQLIARTTNQTMKCSRV